MPPSHCSEKLPKIAKASTRNKSASRASYRANNLSRTFSNNGKSALLLSDVHCVTDCSANGCGNVTAKNKTPAVTFGAVATRLFRRFVTRVPCQSAQKKFRSMKNLARCCADHFEILFCRARALVAPRRDGDAAFDTAQTLVLPDSHRRFRNLRWSNVAYIAR